MPRIVQNDFGAGEVSPALYARTEDGSILRSSLRYLKNMLLQPGGWLTRRGGTRYIAEIKNSSKAAELHRFTISGVGQYVVEFSETAARFYRYNSSTNIPEQIVPGTPVELTSGWVYDEADMSGIRVVSDGEDLHINSPDYFPRTLSRTSDTSWSIARDDAAFSDRFPALEERGRSITLTPGSTTAGAVSFIQSSEPIFDATSASTLNIYQLNGGYFRINGSLSTPTQAQGVNLGDPPDSTTPTNDWTYFDRNNSDEGVNITYDTAAAGEATSLSSSGALFASTDVGSILDVNFAAPDVSLVLVTSVTNSTTAEGVVIHTALTAGTGTGASWLRPDELEDDITMSISNTAVGTGKTLTASSAYFTAAMVRTSDNPGAMFGFLGGYCEVTAVASPPSTTATVETLKAFGSTAPTAVWRESWSGETGYPRFPFLHQSRLGHLDVDGKNQTFWLSKTNKFTDFLPVTNRDDSGISFDYKDAGGNLVAAYSAGDLLLIAEGVAGKISAVPISQSNFGIDTQSRIGGARVAPILAGGELLFVGRSGLRLYGMSFDDSTQRYQLPNRSFFGEHLFSSGIKRIQIGYEPQPVVWVLLTDGTLLSFVYDNLNRLQGWGRVSIGGDATVDSICVVPGNGRDDLWLIAKRTINGATARYVEVLDPDYFTDSFIYEETSFSTLTVSATEISGLDHLEGEDVQIRLNGVYRSHPSGGKTFTVSSGAIDISGLNLSSAPTSVEVGLGFQYRMDVSPAAFNAEGGPSIGMDIKLGGARVLVKDTLGLYDYDSSSDVYHLIPQIGRETTDAIGSAPPLYTGWAQVPGPHGMTDESDPVISLAGDLPLPASILAIAMDVEAQ